MSICIFIPNRQVSMMLRITSDFAVGCWYIYGCTFFSFFLSILRASLTKTQFDSSQLNSYFQKNFCRFTYNFCQWSSNQTESKSNSIGKIVFRSGECLAYVWSKPKQNKWKPNLLWSNLTFLLWQTVLNWFLTWQKCYQLFNECFKPIPLVT